MLAKEGFNVSANREFEWIHDTFMVVRPDLPGQAARQISWDHNANFLYLVVDQNVSRCQ